jgi:hypothetical protein
VRRMLPQQAFRAGKVVQVEDATDRKLSHKKKNWG